MTPPVPVITSGWRELFRPAATGRYVNDHTLVRDDAGDWHLFGITSHTDGDPEAERSFVHASGPSLRQPLVERGTVIDDGNRAWAPAVVRTNGIYVMIYGPSPTKAAASAELTHWFGEPVTLLGTPPMAAHRDHMVIHADDSWLMYAVGLKDGHGCVSLHRSDDLRTWRFAGYALTTGPDAPLRPPWGACESPFVLRHEGLYYLFLTYTDSSRATYHNTLVLTSDDPTRFGHYDRTTHDDLVVATLPLHAPEVVHDGAGWLVTTCGWPNRGVPIEGAVAVATLEFR